MVTRIENTQKPGFSIAWQLLLNYPKSQINSGTI